MRVSDTKTKAKKDSPKKTDAKKSDAKKSDAKKADAKKSGGKATFKIGDKVSWKSHGSEAVGKIEKKITKETDVAGRKVTASKDEPQYLVRSEKSGGTAVHKPKALTPAKSKKGK